VLSYPLFDWKAAKNVNVPVYAGLLNANASATHRAAFGKVIRKL